VSAGAAARPPPPPAAAGVGAECCWSSASTTACRLFPPVAASAACAWAAPNPMSASCVSKDGVGGARVGVGADAVAGGGTLAMVE
jgi:hypothetical protein